MRIDSEIMDRLKRVKQIAGKRRLPVAVGFGIHSPEDARKLQQGGADGVIIGTALVEAVAESSKRAERFILEIARALAGDC
jgi:tryptophan synthase alpha chain